MKQSKGWEFCQENTLVIANTLFQQHKRWFYTWTSPDGPCKNQIDYVLCNWRWRSSIQSVKTRPGGGCGSHHELLIAKFRLKLKKVDETNRPFRYDLNQIPMIIQWRRWFKGLDLVDRVPAELQMEVHHIVQEAVMKTIPKKKKCKKAKSGCLRRLYRSLRKQEKQKAKEKGKDIPNWIQSYREQQGEIKRLS